MSFFTSQLDVQLGVSVDLVPGTRVPEEGMVLVRELINGTEHCRVSTDVAAPYLGFSYAETLDPVYKSIVEVLTVDSAKKVTLKHVPVTGQYSAKNLATGAAVTIDSADQNVLTTQANAQDVIEVTYRYAPTVEETLLFDRTMIPKLSASDMTRNIGVIIKGTIFTNYFDASANYADTTKVLGVASGGLVTMVAPTDTKAIPRAEIISIPSQDKPYLGIRLL